jgi:hypothetical protein
MKNRGVNVVAVNASYGCYSCYNEVLRAAIADLGNAGILFIAAAGNEAVNTDSIPHYPSSYDLPNVISVAATDHNDSLAWFSNYGATTVDLAAPGTSILSTYWWTDYTPGQGSDRFFDSMESGSIGWVSDALWAITNEQHQSPTHSWSDSPDENYANNTSSSLTTPSIDLNGVTEPHSVGFSARYDLEENYDFLDIYYQGNSR